jgi:isochorismate synthase
MESGRPKVAAEQQMESSGIRFLKQLHPAAVENGYSFALWRLPNDIHTQAILSFSTVSFDLKDSFEDFPSGFLFHPFDSRDKGIYLKADLMFRFLDNQLQVDDSPLTSLSLVWFQENVSGKQPKKPEARQRTTSMPVEKTRNDFEDFVRLCLTHIERGDFEKVVPSRCKSVALPDNFDVIEAFYKLCAAYPNALISFVYTPDHGAWLGATPEVLVSIEDKTTFRTVALAGTQEYRAGVNLRDVAWTQKEIEEQALVSRYIINCFKKIRLREFTEHGPKTTVAGNLMHLKTDFSVDMKATNFPQLGSVMLRLLHPTSAVCGMPMESASAFLIEHEDYNRSFYSGFLGPINFQHNSHLFVNLRCMELLENRALCYAGAGVTVDSVPEREWQETEVKMNTLLQVII